MLEPYDKKQKKAIIVKFNKDSVIKKVVGFIFNGNEFIITRKQAEVLNRNMQRWIFGDRGVMNYSQLSAEEQGRFKLLMNCLQDSILSNQEKATVTEKSFDKLPDPIIKAINDKIVSSLMKRLDEIHTGKFRKGHDEKHFAIKQILKHIQIDNDYASHHKVINLSDIERLLFKNLSDDEAAKFKAGTTGSKFEKLQNTIVGFSEIAQKPDINLRSSFRL